MGEHGSERDDIARGYIPVDRLVLVAAFDHVADGAVDPLTDSECVRSGDWWAAVEREYQLIALVDGGLDEAPQGIDPARGSSVSGLGVGEHLLEGSVGEVCQELVAGGEVTVQRRDADPGVGGDCRHRYPRAFAMHRCGRRPD